MKLALKILGVLLLLALAAPFAMAWWLQSYVSPDYLVKATEEQCNCRAELDSSTLTIFSWPPTLRLSGIKIGPRDEHVRKPLKDRPPLKDAPIQIQLAYAELLSDDIWQRRITPNLISFAGIEVQETLDPTTGSALEKLFLPPPPAGAAIASTEIPRVTTVTEAPVPEAPAPGTPRTYDMTTAPPVEAVAPPPKPGRIPLREIRFKQAHFHITNHAVAAHIDADIRDLDLILSDIDIDPDDLTRHNRLHASLKTKITVKGLAQINGKMQPVQFADISLQGTGKVVPINPTTLTWKPEATLDLILHRGSTIGGHMTLGDAAGDQLNKLKEYGIDLSAVRIGGSLTADATASVFYDREALFFKAPTRIALPDIEFTVKQDAWINTTRDAQYMPVHILFGPTIREPLINGIKQTGLGDSLSRAILSLISDEAGNPYIDLVFTGSLSNPKPQHELMNKLEKLTKGSGVKELLKDDNIGNLLQGLLKKL